MKPRNNTAKVSKDTLRDLEYRFYLLGALAQIAGEIEVLEGNESCHEHLSVLMRNGENRRSLMHCIDTLSSDSAELVIDLHMGRRH